MNSFTFESIRENGFQGFISITDLQTSKCSDVPNEPGVYIILAPEKFEAHFLLESMGGHFKNKNPTVCIECLKKKWIEDTRVLYIGKVGPKRTLRQRLSQYMQFGQGRNIGHWGGRYIWQLKDAQRLYVCWRVLAADHPRIIEKQMICDFEAIYDKRSPFANLCH